ncbi:hypothetical protein BHM03_00021660 [Ensete ventricosum]|uniref:Remorin C-terminal domain-containing protein n=2 Tax=Ensete ventricosum TaxID=4639 RepID=A0A445MG30_ENSVE|nr:hypothetical protein BHM03_00021660 [Ensete ventricosum]
MVGSGGRRWKKLGDVTLGRGYAKEGVAGKQRQQHYFVRQCCDRGGSDVDVWGMVGERREEVEDGGSGRQRRARLQQREEEVEEATVRVWRPLAVHWQGLVGDSGREAREEGSIVGSIPLKNLAGASTAESCKDVECSISMETTSGHRSREHAIGGSRFRAQEDDGLDTESVSSGFEFQKVERAPPHRLVPVAPFSKPAPSKWDDAQKWIVSPTSNRVGNKAGGGQARKGGFAGHGSRQPVTKVVLEVEEADTKRVDGSQAKKEFGGVESVNWVTEPYAEVDSGAKPVTIMENPVADIAGKKSFSDTCVSSLSSSRKSLELSTNMP